MQRSNLRIDSTTTESNRWLSVLGAIGENSVFAELASAAFFIDSRSSEIDKDPVRHGRARTATYPYEEGAAYGGVRDTGKVNLAYTDKSDMHAIYYILNI